MASATQRGFHDDWFDPHRVLVVMVDDNLAGVVDAHPSSDKTLHISRIEILPAFQRLGIGRA